MPTARQARLGLLGALSIAVVGFDTAIAHADVSTFYGAGPRESWLAESAGGLTSLGFAGLTPGTPVTDQFEDLGIFFDQAGIAGHEPEYGDGYVRWNHHGGYEAPVHPDDGLRAIFASPMHSIAMDHFSLSSQLHITLYQGGDTLWSGIVGPTWELDDYEWPWAFGGVVSDQAFDRVWITSVQLPPPSFPTSGPNFFLLDTLMFSTVPAPGAIATVGFAWFVGRKHRRR